MTVKFVDARTSNPVLILYFVFAEARGSGEGG